MTKRIMVDMSATLLHHGHIRLIRQAAKQGSVIIGLTTDEEILQKKGYLPELNFEQRREILLAIKGVDEVVATPWLITEAVLQQYRIDLLVHGSDHSNPIDEDKCLILPRTEGISSSQLRYRALSAINQQNQQKLMLTPGPAAVADEVLTAIKPVFGRGDADYQQQYQQVMDWLLRLSGMDQVLSLQGSATLALELAAHSFVDGRVLLINTGFYSGRLQRLLPQNCQLKEIHYQQLDQVEGQYDWLMCAYTETSCAFRLDLDKVAAKAKSLGAKLYVDATASIGLESGHHLADVMAFSSCKGLLGLAGAAFIAWKNDLEIKQQKLFYFNMQSQQQKLMTGPYHAIASLYGVMQNHAQLRQRVMNSKQLTLQSFADFIPRQDHQPLLCTYLQGKVVAKDDQVVLYSARSNLPGSVICHLGEIHHDMVCLNQRIRVEPLPC